MTAGQTVIANMIVRLGMDTSKLEQSSNNTSQQIEKLGSVISKSFVKGQIAVKVLSAVLDGAKKAASAVVGAFTSTVKASKEAYASFEQLSGGAELMFGKAFDSVSKNAQNAWQTVQMSQNEYLQQANGFATGLKTALGGNEQAAADLAHKIIVAQADVISATGNSREAVQNAFNGIMKSNYTMLDNLQLGIKPTKEGFQEMIDSVNAWNTANGKATNYQIDNLADAQAALVDYISMQGLAGYAASEAAGTIEGATASVNAAWENVKVSLAGGGADIMTSFEALGTAATSWITNVVPRIGTIMGGIGEAMAKTIPGIGEKMISVIPTVVPKFVAGGLKLGVGLVKGIGQGLKVLWALLKETWNQLGKVLEGLGLKKLGENILRSIWDGIKIGWNDMLAWVYEVLGDVITAIEGWLNEKLGKLAELPILKDLFKDFKNVDLGGGALQGKSASRKTAADQLRDQQTVIMGEIQDTLEDFSGDLFDKCDDILEKEDGISGQVNKSGNSIVDAVNGGGTGGESDYTLLDVIKDDRQRWYETYTVGGNYDLDLLKEIQGHVDQLQSKGIYISNADVLGDTIPPEIKDALKTVSAAKVMSGWEPTDYTKVGEQIPDDLATNETVAGINIESINTSIDGIPEAIAGQDYKIDKTGLATDASVKGVTSAVNGKEYSPTINAPDVDTDPIVSAIQGINITVNTTVQAMDTSGIVTAIQGITVDVHADIPQAEVSVDVDTSKIDTTATALTTAASDLSGAGDSLGGSATNLTTAAALLSGWDGQSNFAVEAQAVASWTMDGYSEYFNQLNEQQTSGGLQPIPEDVITSYQTFATAIGQVKSALTGGGEEGDIGLVGTLGGVPQLFTNILTAAQPLAGFFGGGMISAIDTLMQHVCVATTDEEGNVSAGGGNTLYTALGSVYGLFQDILAVSQQLAAYWTDGFISASQSVRGEAGLLIGVVESLGAAGQGAADQYWALTENIYAAVDAYLYMNKVMNGGGQGGGNGKSEIDMRASGGPVRGGSTYIVGEWGPELFTPRTSGYIVPNEDLHGGGDRQEITVNIGNVYGESYLKDYVNSLIAGTIRKELRLAA